MQRGSFRQPVCGPPFYDTRGSIDVALFEREQLRGVKRGRGREHDHRTEARPELLGERANLRPGIERPLRRELGKAHLTRPAVAFPSSQRSFATVTSFRLLVLLDQLAERQIRRTAIGQDPAQLDLERPLRSALLLNPPTCSLAEPRLRRDSGRPTSAPRPRTPLQPEHLTLLDHRGTLLDRQRDPEITPRRRRGPLEQGRRAVWRDPEARNARPDNPTGDAARCFAFRAVHVGRSLSRNALTNTRTGGRRRVERALCREHVRRRL